MTTSPRPTGLGSSRAFSALAIVWERFWPLILPLLMVIAGFLIVSWFGLWPAVPNIVRIGLLMVFGLAIVASLVPLKHFRLPGSAQVDHRIELASGFIHRPVTAQFDELAAGQESEFSRALWREHKNRTGSNLDGLKSGGPKPDVASRDPWALRAVFVLVLFVAFGFASGNHLVLIKQAFTSNLPITTIVTRIDAWVSPPAYTGRPPLFLKSSPNGNTEMTAIVVPKGSELIIRAVSTVPLTLKFISATSGQNFGQPPGNIPTKATNSGGISEYRHLLGNSGIAQLSTGDGKFVGEWTFTVLADKKPVIRFTETPRRSRGRVLDLAFTLRDDYAGVSAIAEIRLPATPDTNDANARPLVKSPDIALPVPSRLPDGSELKYSRDLSQHPFAGGKVIVTLVAKDGAGQTGRSAAKEVVLPGRIFSQPLAAALVEQRRILASDARNARDVANMLDIIANTAPEELIKSTKVFTGLQVVWRTIARATSDDQLREGLELLWEIALAIEDGELSEAAARLRDAQNALKEALENGASDKEIERLMKELREAMNQYLNELSEQLARNPQNQNGQPSPDSQMLRKQDIDKILDRIEDLAKSGSKDAAQQLLSELQQMMNQLQAGLHQQQRRGETGDQFNQQMNELARMMQQQQQLMDETFSLQQRRPDGQNSQNQNGQQQQNQQGNPRQGGQRQMSEQEFAEALKQLQQQQGALRDQLQQMMEGLAQMGLQPGRQLGEAGEAMAKARDALGKGQNGEALGEQGKALRALRSGAQAMMKQMQQNMAGERGGEQSGQRNGDNRAGNDPLGRQQRTQGPNFGGNVKVPDEIDAQTAREILETIRRKLAIPDIPKLEFNYLDRLLKVR